ncbi:MAG TPA: hypothetical protein VFH95_14625 [Candidatus Kapabacteria bacterium]|nr:hypothetical protein [Candidatus Kapabacteria bacterium]
MRKSPWLLLSRATIVAALYPWLVSFGPDDSLSHQVSIYGSEGSYTYINRDCSNNITSRLPVPFSEVAASYEAPINDVWGYKLRAGYLHTAYGYNILPYNTSAVAQNTAYGGASLDLKKPYWGVDFGALGFSRPMAFANDHSGITYTLGARFGYLSAWYLTMGMLNSDPIIGSRPAFNSGIGFALSDAKTNMEPAHLWLGVEFGPPFDNGRNGLFAFPYDGVVSGELAVPAFRSWLISLRGGVDPNGQGSGYMSGGLSYRW